MDELEGPKEVIEQTLNHLEQQVQEYHEASALLRKALAGNWDHYTSSAVALYNPARADTVSVSLFNPHNLFKLYVFLTSLIPFLK